MVRIDPPGIGAPARPIGTPIYHLLEANTRLFRIYDPTDHGTSLGYRYWGPIARFDHHLGLGPPDHRPSMSGDRAVYYAAFTLSGWVVEVSGDDGAIVCQARRVVKPTTNRDLRLLDIRRAGAMQVGSVAALAKTVDRSLSQAWARHLYRHPATAGLIYCNAHNDEDAVVFFESAEDALSVDPADDFSMNDPHLRVHLRAIGRASNLAFL